jgi:hypothetical protein
VDSQPSTTSIPLDCLYNSDSPTPTTEAVMAKKAKAKKKKR